MRAPRCSAAGVQARITVEPASAVAGQIVTLSAAASLLPAGRTITAYQWAVTSGAEIVPELAGATSPTATVTPSGAGAFTVSLTVTDDTGVVSSEAATVAAPPSKRRRGALGFVWLIPLASAVVALRVLPAPHRVADGVEAGAASRVAWLPVEPT
jgi:serine protease